MYFYLFGWSLQMVVNFGSLSNAAFPSVKFMSSLDFTVFLGSRCWMDTTLVIGASTLCFLL